jgi:uncharacterized protein YbaR (Trm112 family)
MRKTGLVPGAGKSSTGPAKMPAMISQDLLDMLVCPVCRKPLALRENPPALKCGACRRIYPIKDDIPVLLVDEATIEPS